MGRRRVASGARADVRRTRIRPDRVAGRQRVHHGMGDGPGLRRRLAPDGASDRSGDGRAAERDRPLRGAGRPVGVPQLLRLRRGPPRARAVGDRLADRAVRRPQPDRRPHGSRWPLPWWGADSVEQPSCTSAGSVPGAWPPSCSPCCCSRTAHPQPSCSWTSPHSPSGSASSCTAPLLRGLPAVFGMACTRGPGHPGPAGGAGGTSPRRAGRESAGRHRRCPSWVIEVRVVGRRDRSTVSRP